MVIGRCAIFYAALLVGVFTLTVAPAQSQTPPIDNSVIVSGIPISPDNLTVQAGSGQVTINFKTGRVTIVGASLDQATLAFWTALAKLGAGFCRGSSP